MKDFSAIEFNAASFEAPRSRRMVRKSLYTLFGKRFLDLLIVTAAIIPVSLIVGVAYLIVRLNGGPGFYSQLRVGKDGKLFKCYKLRTMHVDAEERLKTLCAENPEIAAEWHKNQKLKNDPRIIRFGKFMRETSIDELPQVYNVLFGDMSIIGPRPFTPDQNEFYREAGGSAYYQLKPGLTGLWQIKARGSSEFVTRVVYDNAYARTLSLKNDILIVLKTFAVVLARTGE